jgi:hypothetical protein
MRQDISGWTVSLTDAEIESNRRAGIWQGNRIWK